MPLTSASSDSSGTRAIQTPVHSSGSSAAKLPSDTRSPSRETSASFINRIFILWVTPLIWRGWKRPLEDDDLPELCDDERGAYTTRRLREQWYSSASTQEGDGGMHSKGTFLGRLPRAVLMNHRKIFIIGGILKVFDITLSSLQPVLINRLLRFLADKSQSKASGFIWAFLLLLTPVLRSFVEKHYFLSNFRGGMRVRSSFQGLLYEKSLSMSPSARAAASLGEVVNLMQLDAQRAGDFFQFVHVLWGAPVQIIVTVVLLFIYIDVSAIFGLLITVLTIPLQGYLMSIAVRLRTKGVRISDVRVKLVNEVLQGIKSVKAYAWERPFAEQVAETRAQELSNFGRTIIVRSAFSALMFSIPTLIAVVTFTFYAAVFKNPLDPAKVFTGIALLNQLRTPVAMLPLVVNSLIDAKLAKKRIEDYLLLEDTDDYDANVGEFGTSPSSPGMDKTVRNSSAASAHLQIVDGVFEWGHSAGTLHEEAPKVAKDGLLSKCIPSSKKAKKAAAVVADAASDKAEAEAAADARRVPFLRDISLNFKSGELIGIVGRVGSGKSSLVQAMLGEMKRVSGSLNLSGSVAYVAQSAWILNASLKENIIFGNTYDDKRYRLALRVSALGPDIAMLPSGDQTAIGEKGINLSGGQKQRVSIARAVYADADIYVFDDPLSALDSHVGQSVFNDCMSKSGVLKSKLRILVTNQLHILPECDRIILMVRGLIKKMDVYENMFDDAAFRELNDEVQTRSDEGVEDSTAPSAVNNTSGSIKELSKAASDGRSPGESAADNDALDIANRAKTGGTLMQTEERETGHVSLKAYYHYALACGGVTLFTTAILINIVAVTLSVLTNWWLVYWTDNAPKGNHSSAFYLGIYFGLGFLFAFLTFARSAFFLRLALRASKSLHARMLNSVLRAPMSFFDTTPIGRVLSRFSRDVNAVDQLLPDSFGTVLFTLLNLISSYVYIGTVLPLFIAFAVPVTFVYYALQRFYNRTAIELKRLDSISKSPIYANFSETLGGLSTIRAYRKQNQFRMDNVKMIDINQRAFFLTIASNQWFSLYLEVFGSLLVFATAVLAVLTRGGNSPKSSSAIGLGLTYALQVTGILGYTIRSITDLETYMNSVERLNYYGQQLPQEAPAVSKEGVISCDWPRQGEIEFRDVEVRYREGLDVVLKGISVKVRGGEKVGVVGRTGSGKSTLMLALLRLVEVSGGVISVDGVDLSTVGLDDVRSRMTIIPQDPVCYAGSIRFNLDPFGVYSEPELWDALGKSHLREFVQEFEGGLDETVAENGDNISGGQRQMICLTRALLRRSRVLIMDEASANLDPVSDALVQGSIEEHMGGATILTIAHRLWTLVKCDRVLVMSGGVAREYDAPEVLLAQPDSELRFLVDAMGAEAAGSFRTLVHEHARAVGRMA
jgi:ATP-binding cassette, subfamily C (CFTR/MRP), member 1